MRNKNESGRSMVEMLGVLAIIGLLSVMGIAGYINAMQKHKTNTVIHEAAKRAVSVSGQLSTAPGTIPSLSGFETETEYANFPSVEKVEGQEQFKLTIDNMSESLCQSVKSIAETDDFIQQVDASCANGSVILYYNNSLDSGLALANEDQDQGPSCSDDQEVVDGTCMARCPEGVTRARDKSCSVCANGNVYLSYSANPCQNSISGCKNNADCGEGEYCSFSASNCTGQNMQGSCQNISNYGPITVTIQGVHYKQSSSSLNWWSAKSWCEAQGYHMPSSAELCGSALNLTWNGDTYLCKNCCTPMRDSNTRDLWVTEHHSDCNPYHIYTGDGGSGWMNTGHNGSAYVICLE